jgi:P27 family predicted phage terminase small subunit
MAGRPPKPSALKAIEGNKGKRAGNNAEPEFDLVSDLEPPWHLDDGAQQVWRELAFMLRKAQVFTVADKVALELLCNTIADIRLVRARRGDEFVIKSPKTGSEMLAQHLVAEQMLVKRAEALLAKFGMDPASRSKVVVNPQGDLFGGGDASNGTGRFFK